MNKFTITKIKNELKLNWDFGWHIGWTWTLPTFSKKKLEKKHEHHNEKTNRVEGNANGDKSVESD